MGIRFWVFFRKVNICLLNIVLILITTVSVTKPPSVFLKDHQRFFFQKNWCFKTQMWSQYKRHCGASFLIPKQYETEGSFVNSNPDTWYTLLMYNNQCLTKHTHWWRISLSYFMRYILSHCCSIRLENKIQSIVRTKSLSLSLSLSLSPLSLSKAPSLGSQGTQDSGLGLQYLSSPDRGRQQDRPPTGGGYWVYIPPTHSDSDAGAHTFEKLLNMLRSDWAVCWAVKCLQQQQSGRTAEEAATLTRAPEDRLRLLLLLLRLPQLQLSLLDSLTATLGWLDLPGCSVVPLQLLSTVLQQEALRCSVTSQNTETRSVSAFLPRTTETHKPFADKRRRTYAQLCVCVFSCVNCDSQSNHENKLVWH